jgi:hypothetical protein
MISVESGGAEDTASAPRRSADTANFANRWKKRAIVKIDVTPDVKDA